MALLYAVKSPPRVDPRHLRGALMARSYANIATAIWRDPEFRALSVAGQHAYLLVATQPDISAAGVLSLNLTRWASRTKGCTPGGLRAALRELEAHRFAVIDEDTEELLVRSFVRWDNGFNNPKRRPVIRDAATHVESPALLRVLAAEFDRLGLPDWIDPDSYVDSLSDSHSWPESSQDYDPESSQEDSLSDSQADTVSASERVVVTKGLHYRAATHNPHSATRTPPPGSAQGAARAPGREEPPPEQCQAHLDDPAPPACGRCRDARRARTRWDQANAERQRTAPKCRRHRGQFADNCALCRSEALSSDQDETADGPPDLSKLPPSLKARIAGTAALVEGDRRHREGK